MSSQVSVLIPAYNRADYLPETIESVLNQTYPALEIIVVDDGSIDNTKEVCARYPQVHYIYQTNQGCSASRNTGIRHSKGDYLVFLDSDDLLLPQALEIGVRELDARPELGFVFGNREVIDEHGRLIEGPANLLAKASYESILAGEHIVAPASRMVRRSAFEVAGLFNASLNIYGEDTDMWLRIARYFPIYYHQQPVFQYRNHSDNGSSNFAKMLVGLVGVLKEQKRFIDESGNPSYLAAYQRGMQFWLNMYGPLLLHQLVRHVKQRQWAAAFRALRVMLTYYPQGLLVGFHYLKQLTKRFTAPNSCPLCHNSSTGRLSEATKF